jgi:porin
MWIAGDGLNGDVGELTLVSNINARGGVRVYEAWLEQSVFDRAVSLRAGLLAADQEFILTTAGLLYYNSVFGGPVFLSANMRWPIYPVGALGARLKVAVAEKAYVQAAVYDGDPGSEEDNRYGLAVAVHGHEGCFMIGEAGWTFGDPLPVTLKAGVFHHTGEFVDHSPGVPQRGLSGGYVLAEHTVCRNLTGIGGCPEGSVDVFVRAGVAQEDVATVSFGLDSGINLTGILPGRPADVLGLGFIYARIGTDYAAAQPDAPAWGYEMVVEATYKITFSRWLNLQPDLQYIRHPGGSTATRDAWVIGMRIDVLF